MKLVGSFWFTSCFFCVFSWQSKSALLKFIPRAAWTRMATWCCLHLFGKQICLFQYFCFLIFELMFLPFRPLSFFVHFGKCPVLTKGHFVCSGRLWSWPPEETRPPCFFVAFQIGTLFLFFGADIFINMCGSFGDSWTIGSIKACLFCSSKCARTINEMFGRANFRWICAIGIKGLTGDNCGSKSWTTWSI